MGIGRVGVEYKVLMGLDPVAIRAYPPHVCVIMWLRKLPSLRRSDKKLFRVRPQDSWD